jgi:hypothetical protein
LPIISSVERERISVESVGDFVAFEDGRVSVRYLLFFSRQKGFFSQTQFW